MEHIIPENAALLIVIHSRCVQRDLYARKRGMAASARLHIYGFMCIGISDLRLRATTNTVVAMSRLTATWRCRVRACLGFAGRRVRAIANPAGSIAPPDTNAAFAAHEFSRIAGMRVAKLSD